MGWGNPPVPWQELGARLRGLPPRREDVGGGPAWAYPHATGTPPSRARPSRSTPYAELHCHSHFSFLDGASAPEELAEAAARLGLEALALTDHDGVYGAVRFAEAAREVGVRTVFGAELTLATDRVSPAGAAAGRNTAVPAGAAAGRNTAVPAGAAARRDPVRTGVPDPDGRHLVVLARDPTGYARLCRAVSQAQLAGHKGAPRTHLDDLAVVAGGRWLVLTGCRKGSVPYALVHHGPATARWELSRLVAAFGRGNVAVELWDHGDPLDSHRNDALAELAVQAGVAVVASNNVHYARPSGHRLATAMAAIRARTSLDELDGWLPVAPGAHLRTGAEQTERFRRYPGVIAATAAVGRELAFDLDLVAPDLPGYPVPDGHTAMSWLRQLTEDGARQRYGPREAETVPGAWRQIDHELAVIEALNYPGYFLIVWDIVRFCADRDIYCQGRGSAANSAVCYALGVTRADAVALGLLFERFLTPARDGPPDIDLDIESDRREEAIQYVYDRYGRQYAAQVANVVTYRPRSAIRDAGKALGHSQGQVDAWSKRVSPWGSLPGTDDTSGIPGDVLELATQLLGAPRHLGIHSGGMVLCDRPIVEVCPVEHARMAGRTVLQWDKDDCAATGLVKFDLLGLGMLSALHYMVDLVRDHHGVTVDLAALPQEDAVYAMLCRADAVGVFQVESRAQMATLPRLLPRTFYDLVVEVAIIRPGPIQGGSVHPYIRRRNRQEPVTYPHPLLEGCLKRTLGVPLFQEQLMQMAIDVAGFTAAEADQLRQAMGSKRSETRMERLRQRLYDGMAARGITGATADRIHDQIAAFANFGFPESHSVSFAYLVYASSWLKLHYPAAFLAGLLNAQPMGFYAPQTLVADARRHGVVVRRADVNHSATGATLEPHPASAGGQAVRLGLAGVRDVGDALAARLVAGRPYTCIEDVTRRTGASRRALESLATAGAFDSLGRPRREALWAAGAVADQTPDRLELAATGAQVPCLPGMSAVEETAADLVATGISATTFPTEHVRDRLDRDGVVTAAGLVALPHGRRVTVAGVVTHRQKPATAGGTIFVNLEDETGMVNVICSPGVWARHQRIAVTSPALVVGGRLERAGDAVSVVAQRLTPLVLSSPTRSRDFR